MTILKRVTIGLVALIVLVVVIGFLMPRQVHVERSIVINAPQAQLFDALYSFKRLNDFSPWAALDPEEELVLILMSQYLVADADFAGRFQTLAYQAIVD